MLRRAIEFAKTITQIDEKYINIIFHARKSVLFYKGQMWIKKENEHFDVTMGSWDGAEICELVGLYILVQLIQFIPKECIGLYRDDGLAALNMDGPTMERTRKKVVQIFKNNGLKITTDTNLKIVNFLDVTLDLENDRYKPFVKENSSTKYVHNLSNHPNVVKNNLPEMINSRIINLSSSKVIYDNEIGPFKEALRSAGYKQDIEYKEDSSSTDTNGTKKKKKTRKRKIIWYTPPCNAEVSTNIPNELKKIIEKNFPKGTELGKIFNCKNVKVSNSCMPNMDRIIKGHNRYITGGNELQLGGCKCQKWACPVDGTCLSKSVVYSATVLFQGKRAEYFGISEPPLIERIRNHYTNFKYPDMELKTCLSKKIWELKRNSIDYDINWKIVCQVPAYNNITKRCELCITEKTLIMFADSRTCINKRSEIMSTCRHRRKWLLNNCLK